MPSISFVYMCLGKKLRGLLNLYIKLVKGMSFVKKGKAQSCLQAHQERQSRLDLQKYVVVDSENEDEVINMRRYDSFQHMDRPIATDEKSSVILKSKGSTVTNFLSNPSKTDLCMDSQIWAAEKQVGDLKKQCDFLEKMINDMIEEQSKLTVMLRKRERAQSLSRKCYHEIKSEIPSCQVSFFNQTSEQNTQVIISDMPSIVVKDPLSNITPIFSKNIVRPNKKSLEIIKTVEIKDVSKFKKGQQNLPSKKLQHKKKKNIPRMKQSFKQFSKTRSSICKMRSKAI